MDVLLRMKKCECGAMKGKLMRMDDPIRFCRGCQGARLSNKVLSERNKKDEVPGA